MTKKNNGNQKSGQLARKSQNKQTQNSSRGSNGSKGNNSLGQPVMAAPVAYSSPTLNTPPKVTSSMKMSRIVHRELVTTITGNTTFGTQDFSLNPGLVATFPWLSTVAPSYEQYCFKKLRFHYITRCATSYVGSVLLAPDYDALDAAPTTEVICAMMAGAKEDVPWRDIIIDFTPSDMFPLGPRKFIRTQAVSSSDLKTYDAGQLFVGKAGCADTSNIGKLWVEYDVELHIPQSPSTGSVVPIGAMAIYNLSGDQTVTNNTIEDVEFDEENYDTIGATIATGIVTLPAGNYFVQTEIQAKTSAAGALVRGLTIVIQKNNSALTPPCNSVSSDIGDAAIDTQCSAFAYVSSAGSDTVKVRATFVSGGTLALAGDACRLAITRMY